MKLDVNAEVWAIQVLISKTWYSDNDFYALRNEKEARKVLQVMHEVESYTKRRAVNIYTGEMIEVS